MSITFTNPIIHLLSPNPPTALICLFFSLTHSLICHNFYAIWQFKFTNHDRAKKGTRRDRDGGKDKDEDDVKSSAVVDRVPLISRLQDRELQEMRDDGERKSTREIGSKTFRNSFLVFFSGTRRNFCSPHLMPRAYEIKSIL